MPHLRYTTPRGITVDRTESKLTYARGLHHILRQLDRKRGVYLSSGYEYPERYSRWDVASVAPSLEIVGSGRELAFRALNERGRVLLRLLSPVLESHSQWQFKAENADSTMIRLHPLAERFPEEERSKQPSPFSVLRALIQ